MGTPLSAQYRNREIRGGIYISFLPPIYTHTHTHSSHKVLFVYKSYSIFSHIRKSNNPYYLLYITYLAVLVVRRAKMKNKICYFYEPEVGNFYYGQVSFYIFFLYLLKICTGSSYEAAPSPNDA